MSLLIFFAIITLVVSGFCSLLEAIILSTTTAEIEALKRRDISKGKRLEKYKAEIEETSSAILTLNTVANTLGSIIVGATAQKLFDNFAVGVISGLMTFGILIFSEIIPKNLGVIYRTTLLNYLIYPLLIVRIAMYPFSKLARLLVRSVITPTTEENKEEQQEEEIRLLTEKSVQDGSLSQDEKNIIHNTLSLDDVRVITLMTPRTVIMALSQQTTVQSVFTQYPDIPFARIPVYRKNIDDVIGIVRRRELLATKAKLQDDITVSAILQNKVVPYIPETATAYQALQTFLKLKQQLGIVVDEFGSVVGVLSLEDIMEYIIGQEIYEADDIAVDMRQLARNKAGIPEPK